MSLFNKGEDKLRECIEGEGFGSEDSDQILEHLKSMDFIPLIAFLATNERAQALAVDQLIDKGAEARGVSSDSFLKEIIPGIIFGGAKSYSKEEADHSRRKFIEAVAKKVAENNPEFEAKDVSQGIELLASGQALSDLAGVTRATEELFRDELPRAIIKFMNPIIFVELLADGNKALIGDVIDPIYDTVGFFKKLRANKFGHIAYVFRKDEEDSKGLADDLPIPMFNRTLGFLLNIAPVDVVRDWAVEMLDKKSVRLAILVYAHTQGYSKIKESDVLVIQEALGDGRLQPVVDAALSHFLEDADGDKKKAIELMRKYFTHS